MMMNMKLVPSYSSSSSMFSVYKKKWLWPSCKNPKTPSSSKEFSLDTTTHETFFTNSSESETIARAARSERLVFKPGFFSFIVESQEMSISNAIKNSKAADNGGGDGGALKESVAVAVRSCDPYRDFKKSMEEMVESSGLKDWESLEELLRWYLRMNAEKNHGFIVEAFADLLIAESSGASSSHHSFTQAAFTFSTPTNSISHHLIMEDH